MRRAPQRKRKVGSSIFIRIAGCLFQEQKLGFLSLSACHQEPSPASSLVLSIGIEVFFYRGLFSGVRYEVTGGYSTALYWIVLSRTLLKLTVQTP